MKKILLILLVACSSVYGFDIETVDAPKSFFGTGQPTTIVRYTQPSSKQMVIFLPGGTGSFSLPKPQTESKGFLGMLKSISDAGGVDLAIVNSPYPLNDNPGSYYPAMRDSSDHLDRVEAVIRQYHQTHQIWLMGHSNGTFSITTIMRRLQKQNDTGLIKGLIMSGTRDVAQFEWSPAVPVLFIHHVKDGCRATPYTEAERNFARVKQINSRATKFVAVDSDTATSGNPCYTGYHMMQGAYAETTSAVVNFVKETQ
jgi:hypothetical protein